MADPIAAGDVRPSCEATMQPRLTRWRRYLGALLCIGLSGLFLYLAMRKVDPIEVRKALAAMNLRWLLPMVMVSLIGFWLRAVRWAWIFPPNSRPTVRQSFSTFMIGTMANNLVPGRLGDLARGGMIGRTVPLLGTSGALATVVLEKVMDGLMLLALLGLAFLVAPLPGWLGKVGAVGSLMFLGTLLLLLAVNAHAKASRTKSPIMAQESRFGKIVSAMQRLLHRFALGLNALSSKRQSTIVLILTLPIWLLDFSIMFFAFHMFSLNLPFVAAIVTGVILSIGMMLPAAPGFIGTYQFFTVAGLKLYHVPESQALAMALFLNLFVFTTSTLLGLIALSAEGICWSRLRHPKKIFLA
jgi:uncharacterized protein (TIRG00374 family)